MGKIRQLHLPEFKDVERILKVRKLPQPRVGKLRAIKKYEILHRPFDLRFRGKLNKWLNQIKANNFKFNEIFDERQARVIELYFYPQEPNNKWLNQEEVIAKTDFNSKKKLRASLVSSLLRIWSRAK